MFFHLYIPKQQEKCIRSRYVTNMDEYAMLCYAKSLQSCLALCDPIDGSPSGSPFPGILQARTLEWVAISFPRHESEK